MANGAKIALAVGAGYFLGRTKKSRLALMLAAAGITGKFPSSPTDLVAHGVKSLGGSQQISGLTDQLRGELLNAAKAAAVAAATSRVDALNDRLQGVASPAHASDLADQASAPVRSLAGNRSVPSSDEDIYDADEVDVDDEDEYPSDSDEDEPSDEDEDEEDEYEDAEVEDEYEDAEDEDEYEDAEEEDEYEDAEVVDEDEEPEPDEEPDDESEPAPRPRRRASRQETAPKASTRRSPRASSDAGSTRRRRSSTSTRRAPVRRGR
jgi:hypothetical protein